MNASSRFYYWAPAPNRHLDPLLEALHQTGALIHEFYGDTTLGWQQLGTPSSTLASTRTLLEGKSVNVVRRVLRDLDPEAMHLVHGTRELSASVNLVLGPNAKRFIMGESPLPRPAMSPRRIVRDAYYRRQAHSVTGVFAVSRFSADAMHRLGVPFERIVPAAYALPPFRGTTAPRTANRILFCGRAVLRKGVDMLMQALLVLQSSGARFTFDFVGEGPEAPRVVRFLQQHSIPFVAHGSVSSERVLELMSAASVVAVPSLMWEGWGYVVNEATAACVPVAVSDIVGAAEIVVPGLTGAVFRAGDLDGLVNALRQCLYLARSADPARQEALLRLAGTVEPRALAGYIVEAMLALRVGKTPPVAPWHAVISELGGNGSLDWWRHAGQGRAAPAAPFIPRRLLRQI